jgi:hypothetical protein
MTFNEIKRDVETLVDVMFGLVSHAVVASNAQKRENCDLQSRSFTGASWQLPLSCGCSSSWLSLCFPSLSLL